MKKYLFFALFVLANVSCEKMEDGTVLGWREYYVPTTVLVDGEEYTCKKIYNPYRRATYWDAYNDIHMFNIGFQRELYNQSNQEIDLSVSFYIPRPLIYERRFDLIGSNNLSSSKDLSDVSTFQNLRVDGKKYTFVSGWFRIDDIVFLGIGPSAYNSYFGPTVYISFESVLSDGVDTLRLTNGKTQGKCEYGFSKGDSDEIIIDGKYYDLWSEEKNTLN